MLLDVIKDYSVVMPDLISYLKKRGYTPGYFFVKLDLSLQYIIISEFLLQKYDIVTIVTPLVMGVRIYINRTTEKQDVIFVAPTPESYKYSNEYYIKLIDEAFKYIQNTAF